MHSSRLFVPLQQIIRILSIMKKRLLLTTLAAMVAVITVFAVPAKPGVKKKVTLKDGSTVELTLKGDEHFSYYTDAKGVPCLLKNGQLVRLAST